MSPDVKRCLARQSAAAFKQDLGAARVWELFEKATTRRIVSGADVPALDIARFAKSIADPKVQKQLAELIGPGGLRTIEEFVTKFRSLPPTTAYNAWTTMLSLMGGGAGALTGNIPAAAVGVLTPEIVRNMALVGANPRALNVLMTSVGQGIRAGFMPDPGETLSVQRPQ